MTTPYAPNQASACGRTVRLGDVDLYYEEYGAGPPLLLLHGFGGSSKNWHPFAAQLAERYRLIVVDLRGHGRSTNPRNTFTHREAASDMFHLLDTLGIARFSAMGLSTGGMVLLHMATCRPTHIDAMVLVSATTHFPTQARTIMREASLERMPPPVQEMYRQCATRGDEQIRDLIAQFNAFHRDDDDMNFTPQDLSTIAARTLVVHGDRDRFFPVEIPIGMARSIPQAELWMIPGGEHVPIYDPTIPFVLRILAFLDGANNPQPA